MPKPCLTGPTIVFNGDILCDLDLTAVLRQHQSHQATATLVLTRVQNPSAYGLVETTDDGRITRFLEKPSADEITCNTINAGTYILEPEVLKVIPSGENYSFERGVFPGLLRDQRPVYAYVSEGYWIDIGTPQKYMQVHQDILHRRFCPADVFNGGGAFISAYGPRRSEQPLWAGCCDWRSSQGSIVFPG